MKILRRHIFIFVIIAVYFIIGYILNITCPIKYIMDAPCPTCGMTRAMLALVRLDFKGYVQYNPMAFFMVIAVILLIHRNLLRKKKLVDWIFALVVTTNTIFYFIRIVL